MSVHLKTCSSENRKSQTGLISPPACQVIGSCGVMTVKSGTWMWLLSLQLMPDWCSETNVVWWLSLWRALWQGRQTDVQKQMWCDDCHFEEHFDKDARLMFRNKCGVMTVTLKSTLTRTPDWCSETNVVWWLSLWRALWQGRQTDVQKQMWCDDCHFEEHFDKDARLMFRNKCGVMTVTLKSTLTRTPDWCSETNVVWWLSLWRALWQGRQTDVQEQLCCDDCEEH